MTVRVVILGGTGFLGSHLGSRLVKEGFEVCSVGRRTGVAGARHVVGDLFAMGDLDALFREVDVCVHLATDVVPSTAEREGYAGLERNLALASRVADACARADVRKLIFASSGGTVYGQDVLNAREDNQCRPIGLYGVQKVAVEALLRSRLRSTSCSLVNLRIGNPYGAGQERQRAHGVVGHLLRALILDSPFTVWGDGTQVRDYVGVQDVVEAFLRAMSYSGEEDVFNVGSGVGTSTNQLIELCQSAAGKRLAITYGAHPAYDVDRVYLNIDRAGSALGWIPNVVLQDGIRNYYQDLLETKL